MSFSECQFSLADKDTIIGRLSKLGGVKPRGPPSWLRGDAVPSGGLAWRAVHLGRAQCDAEDILVVAVLLLWREIYENK